MGPPPPSPRIEGQQHQHQHQHQHHRSRDDYRTKPTRIASATAPVVSSYASLASAPPPSFARKTSTTATSASGNLAAGNTTTTSTATTAISSSSTTTIPVTSASAVAAEYHLRAATSPRGSYPMDNVIGGRKMLLTGSSSVGGRGSGRYEGRGGRGSGRPGGRGSYRGGVGGRGGRFQLSLSSSATTSSSSATLAAANTSADRFGEERFSSRSSELSLNRTGRGTKGGAGSVTEEAGRSFFANASNRRGSTGSVGGRESTTGRFDGSTSRGRGRGRDYMYTGSRGSRGGRSYHRGGRNSYSNRDEGRGRYNTSDGTYVASSGNLDNSYSSLGDNNSVGEVPHPRSSSFSDELPVEGPSPGEIRPAPRMSDGGRSAPPHPLSYTAIVRPPISTYGSLANIDPVESRRGGSQERQASVEPGEQEESPFQPSSTGSVKRRREEVLIGDPGSGGMEDTFKRMAREEEPSSDVPPPLPFGHDGEPNPATAQLSVKATDVSDVVDDIYRNVESRLAEEGRWTSPNSGGSRESPHGTRRLYGDSNFDDGPSDYSSFGGRGRGRGRGRGFRGGRGGRGQNGDYSRSSSDFGGRYGDRRNSLSVVSDGQRGGPEMSPRPFASYSELATATTTTATAASTTSSWRHVDDTGAQQSPRGDWRKTGPPRIMVSSYATLATNPPPRPSPSPATPSSPSKSAVLTPAPEPERAMTPPPSPGPPSGVTLALTRLADLEAQMEFAYAKHIMLMKRHQLLIAQYDHLEGLPVGVDAFQEELDKLEADKAASSGGDVSESAALYA